MRKCAIIGAAGFIGNNLVRVALQSGWEVRAVDKRPPPVPSLAGLDVIPKRADLFDPPSLVAAMTGVDVVFHAAGPYPVRSFGWKQGVEAARRSAANVLAAFRQSGCPRLVYTSSLTTIGRPAGPGMLADEQCASDFRGAWSPYFEQKAVMEEIFLAGSQDASAVVAVNPTFCFGPFDGKTSRQVLVRAARGRLPLYPEVPINAVDVRDVAAGHLLAAERGRPGERYLLGGRNLYFSEILASIARAAGVGKPRWRMPLALGRAAGAASETASLLVRRPPAFPLVGVELLWRSQHVSHAKASRELGYEPAIPIEEALADAVAWFREVGKLPPA